MKINIISTDPEHNKYIGTHNGSMHADECLSCCMLHLLPNFKEFSICRTRNQDYLNKCDIVVDVGGIYDHSLYFFVFIYIEKDMIII